ncbi:ASCH domain-containing protein [Hydrogenophaga sp. NFH-34]|uniref:ASCH domain-containing protein n=1 Tax=Hydrogenophaga sp. NFH-34 TaxID=2744446 RepID=UPI001F451E0E|nr:ASCH domain-containing protein [Hydrogenophaga sp. NFH-34]
MKALSIHQPYPHLIVRGEKRVENRTWATRYRGRLAIHASKNRTMLDPGEADRYAAIGDPLVFGAVVAVCELVDVVHVRDVYAGVYDEVYPWLSDHPHTVGPYCWVLDNVQRIVPIPFIGSQGLWSFPDDLIARSTPWNTSSTAAR